MHAKSDSDVSSLAPSSPPRSPKRPVYYVQSPSRDSHDGDKSSSMQATPVYNSPVESPSHPSFGRHSRASSASRFSGTLRSSSGRKGNHKRVNEKGWPECDVIQEEGSYDDLDEDKGLSRRCQIILGFLSFVLLFTVFCLIIWGAARPYRAEVVVKVYSKNPWHPYAFACLHNSLSGCLLLRKLKSFGHIFTYISSLCLCFHIFLIMLCIHLLSWLK